MSMQLWNGKSPDEVLEEIAEIKVFRPVVWQSFSLSREMQGKTRTFATGIFKPNGDEIMLHAPQLIDKRLVGRYRLKNPSFLADTANTHTCFLNHYVPLLKFVRTEWFNNYRLQFGDSARIWLEDCIADVTGTTILLGKLERYRSGDMSAFVSDLVRDKMFEWEALRLDMPGAYRTQTGIANKMGLTPVQVKARVNRVVTVPYAYSFKKILKEFDRELQLLGGIPQVPSGMKLLF